MDCEKFDQHVIDALYEELDELTAADHKRHTESCTRCAQILAGLKNAREVAHLPLEEPGDDLEERILAAERTAISRRAPWYTKVVRGAAWAGSLAMRPQLAMAALFVLVAGSSLLLLRARPGTVGAPVQVTQRGEPGPTAAAAAEPRRPEVLRGADVPRVGAAREDWQKDDRGADGKKAAEGTGLLASPPSPPAEAAATAEASAAPSGGAADAPMMLADARAQKLKSGCVAALPRFDAVSDKYPSSPEAGLAKQEAQACERQMNEVAEPPAPAPATMHEARSPSAPKPSPVKQAAPPPQAPAADQTK